MFRRKTIRIVHLADCDIYIEATRYRYRIVISTSGFL